MLYEAFAAAAVGGLIWLDRFQLFQIMISRPLVAGPIIGWILGNFEAGLASGMLYELLWLRRPPIGSYIPPDVTMGAVATAAVSALIARTDTMPTAVSALTFVFMTPLCFAGRRLDIQLRVILGKLARKAEQVCHDMNTRRLYLVFFLGLLAGFSCAFVVLVPAIILGTLVVGFVMEHLPSEVMTGFQYCFFIVPLLGALDLFAGFPEKRDAKIFILGITAAVLIWFALGYKWKA